MVDSADSTHCRYCFGPFQLDTARQRLYKDNQLLELSPRLVRTLQLLVENRGKNLDKSYLIEQLWPNAVVEEHNLPVAISSLRKVLGDDLEEKKYILTIPGRGYRFVAEVTGSGPDQSDTQMVQARSAIAQSPVVESAVTENPAASRRRLLRYYRSLPKIALTAALLLLVALFGILEWSRQRVTQSIAVLPFQTVGAEHEGDDGYLGLGMADGLIARLRHIRHVVVRPTAAVAKYQRVTRDPQALGKELQVSSLLDGTVQRTGDQLRLRVKLLRVKDGTILWSDEYQGGFADILSLQDQIAEQATRALALKPDITEQRGMHRHYTGSSDAYEMYMVGRYYCDANPGPKFLAKGISYVQQAITKDPQFALAHAGLAVCSEQLAVPLPNPTQWLATAEVAAQRALQIDAELPEAYLALAVAKTYYDWDFPRAEAAFRKTIELEPKDSKAHLAYAEFLVVQGRFQEAEREAHRALDLDPFSWNVYSDANEVYFFCHLYKDAAESWARAGVETLDEASWYLAWIYASQRQPFPTAITEELLKNEKNPSKKQPAMARLAYIYALQGMRPEAESRLQELLAQYPGEVGDYEIALVYTALGDQDRAFEFLAHARDKRAEEIVSLNVDPRLQSLRSDARFSELLRSVHLSS